MLEREKTREEEERLSREAGRLTLNVCVCVCVCALMNRWKAEDLGLWSCGWSLCSARLHRLHDLFSMVTYQASRCCSLRPNRFLSISTDVRPGDDLWVVGHWVLLGRGS